MKGAPSLATQDELSLLRVQRIEPPITIEAFDRHALLTFREPMFGRIGTATCTFSAVQENRTLMFAPLNAGQQASQPSRSASRTVPSTSMLRPLPRAKHAGARRRRPRAWLGSPDSSPAGRRGRGSRCSTAGRSQSADFASGQGSRLQVVEVGGELGRTRELRSSRDCKPPAFPFDLKILFGN